MMASRQQQQSQLEPSQKDLENEGSSMRMRQSGGGYSRVTSTNSTISNSNSFDDQQQENKSTKQGYHRYRSMILLQQAALSFGFGLVGWYYPRYLIANETTIQHRQVPFQKTSSGDIILDFLLNDPLVYPPTIPSSFLTYTSVFVPIVLTLIAGTLCSKFSNVSRLNEIHSSFCSFCMAIGLSEGLTQILKLCIQRRRPNFYELCQFSKEALKCTASLSRLREANFSFPSGHSSLTCCGMTFLVWYILGKINLWYNTQLKLLQPQQQSQQSQYQIFMLNRKKFWLSILTCIVFWGWTIYVAATRLLDHWHHPSDVIAGLALGFTCSTLIYHHWYPPCSTKNAGIPYSVISGSIETITVASNDVVEGGNLKLPSFNE